MILEQERISAQLTAQQTSTIWSYGSRRQEDRLRGTRRVVANFWQMFSKMSLVFGCIGIDLCKQIRDLLHFWKSTRLCSWLFESFKNIANAMLNFHENRGADFKNRKEQRYRANHRGNHRAKHRANRRADHRPNHSANHWALGSMVLASGRLETAWG